MSEPTESLFYNPTQSQANFEGTGGTKYLWKQMTIRDLNIIVIIEI